MARAINSFPVPLSPVIRTVASLGATLITCAVTRQIASEEPTISSNMVVARTSSQRSRVSSFISLSIPVLARLAASSVEWLHTPSGMARETRGRKRILTKRGRSHPDAPFNTSVQYATPNIIVDSWCVIARKISSQASPAASCTSGFRQHCPELLRTSTASNRTHYMMLLATYAFPGGRSLLWRRLRLYISILHLVPLRHNPRSL